ncbi:hypothetical protein, partial [Bradyrhizobium zhanjiangense]|uniref:hypothetical protein n=1 Tax=Bradyrhizobium zhanjiangense TaxID=1325107 RepID=UPI0019D6C849
DGILKMKSQGSDARSIKTLQSQNSRSARLRFQISHLVALNGRQIIAVKNVGRFINSATPASKSVSRQRSFRAATALAKRH